MTVRMWTLTGVLILLAASADAEPITHTGIITSMHNGKIVLLERGREQTLQYGPATVCYSGGSEVPCKRIRVHGKARVECQTDSSVCTRIIIDQSPQ